MNFFIFFINAPRSAATHGHQMYFGGSVVDKGSTVGIEISPTPPLNFTGVKKCEIWRRFQHHSTLSCSRLKMQQGIRTLKQTYCVIMIALCPRQVWWGWVHASLRPFVSRAPPLNLHGENVLNSQLSGGLFDFAQIFQSLNACHPKCFKSSRSRNQNSRSERDI